MERFTDLFDKLRLGIIMNEPTGCAMRVSRSTTLWSSSNVWWPTSWTQGRSLPNFLRIDSNSYIIAFIVNSYLYILELLFLNIFISSTWFYWILPISLSLGKNHNTFYYRLKYHWWMNDITVRSILSHYHVLSHNTFSIGCHRDSNRACVSICDHLENLI